MAKFVDWAYGNDPLSVRVADGVIPNPKKITGSRIGGVLGMNKWKTPFMAWCEICRVAEPPFEDSKYTLAGKAIEPTLIEWCKENVSPYILTPQEFYQSSQLGYDFFPLNPIFGGMWDGVVVDSYRERIPMAIIEAKTTSRPQDWVDGVPLSYQLQALMYAALLGVERVFVPVAFLSDDDYANPEAFVCTDANTFLYELNVNDPIVDGLTIADLMHKAEAWWMTYVRGNQSPHFDEIADRAYLKLMRTSEVESQSVASMIAEATDIEIEIAVIREKTGLGILEKSLDLLKKQIKPAIIEMFTDKDEAVSANGWMVKKSSTVEIDKDALERDGLLDQYSTTKTTFALYKEKRTNG